MSRYVVAFLSLHEGELVQKLIVAETPVEAMVKYLDVSLEEFNTEDKIYSYAANSDCYISYYEL